MIYNRKKGAVIKEKSYGLSSLNFVYTTFIGRLLLRLAVSRIVSNIYAYLNNRKSSAHKINDFIKSYNINDKEFEKSKFDSFNDFIVRKIKKEFRPIDPNGLISPADSKLSVYKINEDSKIKVKDFYYTINEIVKDETIANEYNNGTCLVFRLAVHDSHRYVYIDDGSCTSRKEIRGVLHTVQPLSSKYKAYANNHRFVSILNTKSFGKVIVVEVGALLVGRIHNHNKKSFKKGDEMGYFELGGSTIILLFTSGKIKIDKDITKALQNKFEVELIYGEKIGSLC